MVDKDKVQCDDCRWQGRTEEILKAPHPFEKGEEVWGCPICLACDSMLSVCDEDGCNGLVSCGTPSPEGYRSTCYTHRPRQERK